MASIGAIFTSTHHTKQLNPWPNSSASHVVNQSQLSACQGEVEPFEEHPSSYEHPTSLRNKPLQKQPGQLSAPIPDWIISVYSHHLMVKSMSCCCVHGSWLFSDSVTYAVGDLVLVLQLQWTSVKCGELINLW